MKKILGIVGSHRSFGNCELAIKEFSMNIEETHSLNLIRLSDFKINSCVGCYKCLVSKKSCILNDHTEKIIKVISECDAIILAAPTYFMGPHSNLKTFTDKGLSFFPYLKKLWMKPSVGIALAGISGKEGYTLLGIENFLKFIMSDIKKIDVLYAALPGEVVLDSDNIKKLKVMANSLFNERKNEKEIFCSICGGDSFRFIEKNKIYCMLCGNYGTIKYSSDNSICVKMNKSGHSFFLSREDLIAHMKWLENKKNEFILKHNDIKKSIKRYKNIGVWIKP